MAPMAMAQAPAKQAAAPKGETMVASVEVTATVTKIDQATRHVTVKADDGREVSFVADSAVKNLAQVKQGDLVKVSYTQALAYEVKKGGKPVGAQTTIAGGSAAVGATPAAGIARQVTATVTIAAIDHDIRRSPSRSLGERTINVRPGFWGVNVGDTVELVYTKALALRSRRRRRNDRRGGAAPPPLYFRSDSRLRTSRVTSPRTMSTARSPG
jgi:hypothetical protein